MRKDFNSFFLSFILPLLGEAGFVFRFNAWVCWALL